jgi:hypothetical protein
MTVLALGTESQSFVDTDNIKEKMSNLRDYPGM